MLRSRVLSLMALCLIVISVLVSGAVFADDVEPLLIVAAEDGVTLPEEWVSGITTITFQNDTEIDFQPTLARFVDGATMEDFMAAMEAQDFAGMLATVSALGSATAKPGESVDVTYDLLEGDYLFINFAPAGPPTLIPFTVAENEGELVEAPEADVEIVMVDFAFALPADLATGEAIWHFSNEGEQIHEIIIYSVEDDATAESVTTAVMEAMMAASPTAPPEMPYEEVFSFVGISPDENAWMTVNLEPGTYAALCVIPDTTSEEMTSHLAHGMITIFTVDE